MKFLHIRLTFRHIPDQPPNIRHQPIVSCDRKRDSIPLKKPSIKIDEPRQSPPIVDVSSVSSLHRSSSSSLTNDRPCSIPTTDPSMSTTKCPICQIPFDTVGIHRPVNDACGHTTCFQCFKTIMIKATGCSLCQREEEELNSQLSDYSVSQIKIEKGVA